MSIRDNINSVKDTINKYKRDRNFRKANIRREKVVELQAAMAKCRGQLEISLKDCNRTIRQQSDYLHQPYIPSTDVAIHEQLMWDAAIAYMLIRDAIYSLSTVSSNESLAFGYDLLEAAIAQMNGKKKRLPTYGLPSKKHRKSYKDVTSDDVVEEKTKILESIFEELKNCGDIEKCLKAVDNNNSVMSSDTDELFDKTSPEYLASLLGQEKQASSDDYDIDDIGPLSF